MLITRQSDPARLLPVVSLLLLCGVFLVGCAPGAGEADGGSAVIAAVVPDISASGGGDALRIVALGDSLTAGLGLSVDEAYPAKLQEQLDREGHALRVVNAGVSGDTSAGGLRRLQFVLEGEADVRIVILALGGNDGLRGLPVDQMKDNLGQIIVTAQRQGAQVLLAGLEAPPNFGTGYTDAFRRVFSELAEEYEVVFVPFLLEGVAGTPGFNQRDGIHPNAEGAERVAAHVWSALRPMLEQVP